VRSLDLKLLPVTIKNTTQYRSLVFCLRRDMLNNSRSHGRYNSKAYQTYLLISCQTSIISKSLQPVQPIKYLFSSFSELCPSHGLKLSLPLHNLQLFQEHERSWIFEILLGLLVCKAYWPLPLRSCSQR
jgi:hypothetical protein